MEKEPLHQGPLPENPDAYAIRTAGVFVVRDRPCSLLYIQIVGPTGSAEIIDGTTASGAKALELVPDIASGWLTVPYRFSHGLTVVTKQDCHIVIHSAVKR